MMLSIKPMTFSEANKYVIEHHRHNDKVAGCKFAIGCMDGDRLCGVALCGRPVSRHMDDGFTLEIYRCCTDGTRNACSKIYGACVRIAKDMGYKRIDTYTLESEDGASLKASNFVCEGEAGGTHWTGKRYDYQQVSLFGGKKLPPVMKRRWLYVI